MNYLLLYTIPALSELNRCSTSNTATMSNNFKGVKNEIIRSLQLPFLTEEQRKQHYKTTNTYKEKI